MLTFILANVTTPIDGQTPEKMAGVTDDGLYSVEYYSMSVDLGDYVLEINNADITGYVGSANEVTLPSKVTINQKTYNVAKVASNLFQGHDINELTIDSDVAVTILQSEDGTNPLGGLSGVKIHVPVVVTDYSATCGVIDLAGPSNSFVIDGDGEYEMEGGWLLMKNSDETDKTSIAYVTSWATSNIPEGVTGIEIGAFTNNSPTSVVLPSSMTEIPISAFENCSPLTSVTFHDGVTKIGEKAFSNTGLTSVDIPDSVTSIGDRAFYGTPLVTVDLPAALQDMHYGAFQNCSDIATITMAGESEYENGGFAVSDNAIYVKENTGWELTMVSRSSDGALTVKDGTVSIGTYAFENSNLTSIVLPETVTKLEGQVLNKCPNLESLVAPGVKNISKGAFDVCKKLSNLEVAEDCVIPDGTLAECPELETIVKGDYEYPVSDGKVEDTPLEPDSPTFEDPGSEDSDLPPFIPTQPAKDDNTVTIVACAAAAVVAAIMAVFLIIDRKQ